MNVYGNQIEVESTFTRWIMCFSSGNYDECIKLIISWQMFTSVSCKLVSMHFECILHALNLQLIYAQRWSFILRGETSTVLVYVCIIATPDTMTLFKLTSAKINCLNNTTYFIKLVSIIYDNEIIIILICNCKTLVQFCLLQIMVLQFHAESRDENSIRTTFNFCFYFTLL